MKVSPFQTIHSYSLCEIILQKGDVPDVTYDENNDSSFKINHSIEEGVLILSIGDLIINRSDFDLKLPIVYITYTELRGVTLYDRSNLKTKEPIVEQSFGIVHYGTGQVNIAVEGVHLDFTIMRSGKIKVSGFAFNLLIQVCRDGVFDGSMLEVEDAKVIIQRNGFANVWAECELDAQVKSNGTLVYKGKPSIDDLFMAKGSTIMPFEWFRNHIGAEG